MCWCGQDIQDKNVVDWTDDEILCELETNEDNSTENILQRWRDSALVGLTIYDNNSNRMVGLTIEW